MSNEGKVETTKAKGLWVAFDSEFKRTSNKFVTPVCCVLREDDTVLSYWNDQFQEFKETFEQYVKEGYNIVVFNAEAEIRFLMSLGYEREYLRTVKWADVYPLWRIILFGLDKYRYGKVSYSVNGKTKYVETRPPKDGEIEDGVFLENEFGEEVPFSNPVTRKFNPNLIHCVSALLDIQLDVANKDRMRDIILNENTNLNTYKGAILEYCGSDTKYLKPLFQKAYFIIKEYDKNFCGRDVYEMGKWMVDIATIETTGIPINREMLMNFSNNYPQLATEIPEECNTEYPFFEKDLKQDRYIRKYNKVEEFINSTGLKWPITKTGKYKTDKKTLKNFESVKEIKKLQDTLDNLREIGYFSPKRIGRILEHIDSENRWRGSLMPYASQTSRNQPKPTDGYVFLMSRWLRTLVQDPNEVIISGDFSAQEIFISAIISKDDNLLKCYKSGDPYLWFAKQTGNIPKDVIRKSNKYFVGDVPVPDDIQDQYKNTRFLFKSIMLGVGYGMGEVALANRLTSTRFSTLTKEQKNDQKLLDSLKVVSGPEQYLYRKEQQSKYYLNLHYTTFKKYKEWKWLTKKAFERNRCLKLVDGWPLIGKLRNDDSTEGLFANSVTNFPIQGTGQVMLRRAVKLCLDNGLKVINTLHDAIYISSRPEDKEKDMKLLEECMLKAGGGCRVDVHEQSINWNTFESNWVDPEKGKHEFEKFGKYFIKQT